MTEKLKALNESKDKFGDFGWLDSPRCPHCGEDFDIRENEAWYLFSEDDTHDAECGSCGNGFSVHTHTTYAFSTDEQPD